MLGLRAPNGKATHNETEHTTLDLGPLARFLFNPYFKILYPAQEFVQGSLIRRRRRRWGMGGVTYPEGDKPGP